ncbi:putative inner membrane protein translocase component YidC [Chlamydia trachomatis]|nr:putative inner membrane protein translocase component YidC [Chlamydia trachomatis]
MKQKKVRASAYDYFKGNTQGEDKNKQIFKRALKILKIIFYFCIFGITLTGCIQSFVIKTSTSSGSGTEFYKNKEDIIPNYTIFEATNKAGKNEITKATKSNNYLISEKDAPVLKQLRVQTEANGNTSNNYGQYSSLIMFHNADNTFEYAKGDKTHEFLFLNSAESKYDPKFN